MPEFECGPIGTPMVEPIIQGDADYNPQAPGRARRYHSLDANGDPCTNIFYLIDTPSYGVNGTLERALNVVRARRIAQDIVDTETQT